MADAPITFRLTENEEHLRIKLQTMAGKQRSAYIREALLFYEKFGDKFEGLQSGINYVIRLLESGSFQLKSVPIKEEPNNEINNVLENSLDMFDDF